MHDTRGFTLIEVLVAVAIMGIALAGIATVSVGSIGAGIQGRHVGAATALAQAKLEDLRSLSRRDADWAEGRHTETGLRADGGAGGSYTREWEVDLDYNGYKKLARVTVTVSWDDGEERSVTLSSLFW